MIPRLILKRARDLIFRAMENTWAIGFATRGKFSRPAPKLWESPGGQNVLVIAPHPDDEWVGCGGTMVLHVRAGDRVRVVFVTDGRKSRALGLDAEEMVQRRFAEAHAATDALGVECVWLGLREGAWEFDALQEKLMQLLRDESPQLVYVPSRVDFHPEHLRVAHVCARVLAQIKNPPRVHVYPIQVPLTARLCNRFAPVGTVREKMNIAYEAYATQCGSLARTWRTRQYAARWYGVAKLAEEFWEMDAAQYVRLHESLPETWNVNAFRSVRMSPFTDPLAYWFGRGERARLKRTADA